MVETRTIVVSLIVGISVTVLAGLAPAMRATRVPPLAAMREGVEIPRRRRSRGGGVLVPLLLVVAILLVVAALAAVAAVSRRSPSRS